MGCSGAVGQCRVPSAALVVPRRAVGTAGTAGTALAASGGRSRCWSGVIQLCCLVQRCAQEQQQHLCVPCVCPVCALCVPCARSWHRLARCEGTRGHSGSLGHGAALAGLALGAALAHLLQEHWGRSWPEKPRVCPLSGPGTPPGSALRAPYFGDGLSSLCAPAASVPSSAALLVGCPQLPSTAWAPAPSRQPWQSIPCSSHAFCSLHPCSCSSEGPGGHQQSQGPHRVTRTSKPKRREKNQM